MTFLQELNQFLKDNSNFNDFVFRTETLDEAKALIKTLYKLGFYWEANTPYTDQEVEKRWSQKKSETCISLGTLNSTDKKCLFHGRQGMFTKQGRMIVNVKTLFEEVDEGDIDEVVSIPFEEYTNKLCPECNNEVAEKAKFCTNCGYRFNVTTKKEPTPENKPKIQPATFTEPKPVKNNRTNDAPKLMTDINSSKAQNDTLEAQITDKTGDIPVLCQILDVAVNQSFIISNSYLNSNNGIFRINKDGYRERKLGPNVWFVSNNEQELAYIIQHKTHVIKL